MTRNKVAWNPASRLVGARVLLLVANKDEGEILKVALTLERAEVLIVASSGEALAQVPAFRPSAIVVDLCTRPREEARKLPGLHLIRWLRQTQAWRGVLSLVISPEDDDKRTSLSAGCTAFLLKPYDVREVVEVLSAGTAC